MAMATGIFWTYLGVRAWVLVPRSVLMMSSLERYAQLLIFLPTFDVDLFRLPVRSVFVISVFSGDDIQWAR